MAAALKVKVLSAAVNVPLLTDAGKPQMRQAGVDSDGKPVVEPATTIVFLDRGDDLPDNVSAEELDRLKAIDAVGTAEEVDRLHRRLTDPASVEAEDAAAAEARLELQRASSGDIDGTNLASATDEQLAAWVSDTKADDVVSAVGGDAAVAARVLEAEKAADGRKTVVGALQKLVDAAGAEQ